MNFEGKVVLITGASSGIGIGTARYLANLGASLSLSEKTHEKLEKIAAECKSLNNVEPLCLVADVTKDMDTEWLISETVKHFGRLDVLVNNASVVEIGSVITTSFQQFDRIMDVNVKAVLHLTMLSIPHLEKTKGCIVNVSSIASTKVFPNILIYSMSKACIDHFTRCTALELAPKQIRVNAINPGIITGDIPKKRADEAAYKEFLKYCEKMNSLGKSGLAKDAASAIAFLASDCSHFITGAVLPIEGIGGPKSIKFAH